MAVVVVFMVMVMIGRVFVGGWVMVMRMTVFVVVNLVYGIVFLAVCRLVRVKHTCSHGN